MEISIPEKDLTPETEQALLDLGLEVNGVGLGSVEFSTLSVETFNKAKKYLQDCKINASI